MMVSKCTGLFSIQTLIPAIFCVHQINSKPHLNNLMNNNEQNPSGPPPNYWTPTRVILILLAVLVVALPLSAIIIMSIPASRVIVNTEDTASLDITVRVTGSQWKWHYEYIDKNISFFGMSDSSLEKIKQLSLDGEWSDPEAGSSEADNFLVLPSGRKIRLLFGSEDIIHTWWVPELGEKSDVIPGFSNEKWLTIDKGKEGVYQGVCAEPCNKGQVYMPIAVKVVTPMEFEKWTVEYQKLNSGKPSSNQPQNSLRPALD